MLCDFRSSKGDCVKRLIGWGGLAAWLGLGVGMATGAEVEWSGVELDFSSAQESVATSEERPNILFIEVDDLTYTYLSAFGSEVNQTPNIDSLASSGVAFLNAMAPGMMCGPSRNCFVTGLYPHNLGFYLNGQMSSLQRRVWTYPAAMRRAGYYTAYVGKSHIRPYKSDAVTNALAEELGFDYAPHDVGRSVLLSKDPNYESLYFDFLREGGYVDEFLQKNIPVQLPEDVYLDGFYANIALDFIDTYNRDKPFLLWVNFTLPHGPYDVPAQYHVYDAANMPGGSQPVNFSTPAGLLTKKVYDPNNPGDVSEILNTQAGHCANMGFMDKQVGRLVQLLESKGLLENTMICFFSDHGVMLGDHYLGKKGTLYRPVTNPSLIVSWPKRFQQDVVVTNVVELQDLLPTVLELGEASDADKAVRPRHKSLVPLLTGTGSYERTAAFAEVQDYVVVTSNRYRYIRGPGANFLFDDMADPHNLTNIAANFPAVASVLDAAAADWFNNTGPIYGPKGLDSSGFALTDVALDSTLMQVEGAPGMALETNGTAFLRFADAQDPAATTTDVVLTFYTRSENLLLKFDYMPGATRGDSFFAHYQNGEFVEEIQVSQYVDSRTIELVSRQAPGTLVRYDLRLPSAAAPVLSRLQLKEGLVLEAANGQFPGAASELIAGYRAFENWRNAFAWGAEVRRDVWDDPDGDGLVNFAEFAFKCSPVVPDAKNIYSIQSDGGKAKASISLGMGSDLIRYKLLMSHDLGGGWNTMDPLVIAGEEDEVVELDLETYGSPLFLRLSIGM